MDYVYTLNVNSICQDHINLRELTILEALEDPNNVVFVYIESLNQKTPYASVVPKEVVLGISTTDRNVECHVTTE